MIGAKKRFVVLQRDWFRCKYCWKNGRDVSLEVDHVIPKSLGWSDELDNLQCICRECNIWKWARDLREWIVEMYRIKMDDAMKKLKKYFYDQINENQYWTVDNTDKIIIHRFCNIAIKWKNRDSYKIRLCIKNFPDKNLNFDQDCKLFEEWWKFCDEIISKIFEDEKEYIHSIVKYWIQKWLKDIIFEQVEDHCDDYLVFSS